MCVWGGDARGGGGGWTRSKFILHSNNPAHADFGDYSKCNYRLRLHPPPPHPRTPPPEPPPAQPSERAAHADWEPPAAAGAVLLSLPLSRPQSYPAPLSPYFAWRTHASSSPCDNHHHTPMFPLSMARECRMRHTLMPAAQCRQIRSVFAFHAAHVEDTCMHPRLNAYSRCRLGADETSHPLISFASSATYPRRIFALVRPAWSLTTRAGVQSSDTHSSCLYTNTCAVYVPYIRTHTPHTGAPPTHAARDSPAQ